MFHGQERVDSTGHGHRSGVTYWWVSQHVEGNGAGIQPCHTPLWGKIGGAYGIQMEVTIEGDGVAGVYWYDSVGIDPMLRGFFVAGKVNMVEAADDGKITGR